MMTAKTESTNIWILAGSGKPVIDDTTQAIKYDLTQLSIHYCQLQKNSMHSRLQIYIFTKYICT